MMDVFATCDFCYISRGTDGDGINASVASS